LYYQNSQINQTIQSIAINRYTKTQRVKSEKFYSSIVNLIVNLFSGYINQSLEVDEYFPPLMHTDEYEHRTDNFDNDDMEDELQFSDHSDIEFDDDDVKLDTDYNIDNDYGFDVNFRLNLQKIFNDLYLQEKLKSTQNLD